MYSKVTKLKRIKKKHVPVSLFRQGRYSNDIVHRCAANLLGIIVLKVFNLKFLLEYLILLLLSFLL